MIKGKTKKQEKKMPREMTEFMQLALMRVLPNELSKIILEFVLPVTREDWREGGSFPSCLFIGGLNDDYYFGPFPSALHENFNSVAHFHYGHY